MGVQLSSESRFQLRIFGLIFLDAISLLADDARLLRTRPPHIIRFLTVKQRSSNESNRQSDYQLPVVPSTTTSSNSNNVRCRRLRQTERTRIHIDLRYERSDADLAQALEQNPFVTEIELNLEGEQRVDWNYLLRVIATRANLETVKLLDRPHRNAPSALVRSILRAIQQNTTIRTVELNWLRLPADISTFVDNASSITSFCLDSCVMDPASGTRSKRSCGSSSAQHKHRTSGTQQLGGHLHHSNLRGLEIQYFCEDFCLFTCLVDFSDAAAHALQHLLESTTSIQRVEWEHASFSENQFRPIAQAMTSSECVSELKFSWVRFHDGASVAQFRSILQNKRNLTVLCLYRCHLWRRTSP